MLRLQLFVILCVILNMANAQYGHYHNGHHQHRHHHVGCHNGCVRRGPPICEKWCIVYVTIGFCRQARYECCKYRDKPGYCPAVKPTCAWNFPYFTTKYYECGHDYNCPAGFKCCQDFCFTHKVCKPCSSTPPHLTTTTASTRDTEETSTRGPFETTDTPIIWEETTTEVTTTLEPEEITPEPEETTVEAITTPEPEEITTPTTTPPLSTTLEETEGSGNGDDDVPAPEAARFRKGFIDDEDYKDVDDFGVY